MGRSNASAQKISAKQRRIKALNYRLQGFTYREIGERMGGVTLNRAHQIVADGLKELTQKVCDSAEKLRTIEAERLDKMLLSLKFKLEDGDVKAINAALRISDRRSRLYGLDLAPPDIAILPAAMPQLVINCSRQHSKALAGGESAEIRMYGEDGKFESVAGADVITGSALLIKEVEVMPELPDSGSDNGRDQNKSRGKENE